MLCFHCLFYLWTFFFVYYKVELSLLYLYGNVCLFSFILLFVWINSMFSLFILSMDIFFCILQSRVESPVFVCQCLATPFNIIYLLFFDSESAHPMKELFGIDLVSRFFLFLSLSLCILFF